MNTARKLRPRETSEAIKHTVAGNVELLWTTKEWKQTDRKGRTVDRLRTGEANPELHTLEFILSKAGIPIWYLLVPHMDSSAIQTRELEEIVFAYLKSPEKRKSIKDIVIALSK